MGIFQISAENWYQNDIHYKITLMSNLVNEELLLKLAHKNKKTKVLNLNCEDNEQPLSNPGIYHVIKTVSTINKN